MKALNLSKTALNALATKIGAGVQSRDEVKWSVTREEVKWQGTRADVKSA